MDFQIKRLQLVGELRLGGVVDERVLAAMGVVARETFLPETERVAAYTHGPLAIGYGQLLPPPLHTARALQALALTSEERVLEVGTGSGYEAALMAHLAAQVVTVERVAPLRLLAVRHLAAWRQVQVGYREGLLGDPEAGPYQAIVVTAGVPHLPHSLVRQLAPGGRMLVPIGSRSQQTLWLLRQTSGGWQEGNLGPCALGPLIGEDGWPEGPFRERPHPAV